MEICKTTVARAFGRAKKTYRINGDLQRQVAKLLCQKFAPFPKGNWLEVGCGTGFLTEQLLSFQPQHLFANDISDQMGPLLPKDHRIEFIAGDGESLDFPPVSMIASSFALQWFSDPIAALKKWSKDCEKVIVAIPISPSFAEWEALTKIPLNRLPTAEQLSTLNGRLEIETFPLHFASPRSFLVWLKKLGANISLNQEKISLGLLRELSKQTEPFQTQATVAFLEVVHV